MTRQLKHTNELKARGFSFEGQSETQRGAPAKAYTPPVSAKRLPDSQNHYVALQQRHTYSLKAEDGRLPVRETA